MVTVITERRVQKGLTSKELAEKIGVTQQTMYLWETGKSQPNLTSRVKLKNMLGGVTDEYERDNIIVHE